MFGLEDGGNGFENLMKRSLLVVFLIVEYWSVAGESIDERSYFRHFTVAEVKICCKKYDGAEGGKGILCWYVERALVLVLHEVLLS